MEMHQMTPEEQDNLFRLQVETVLNNFEFALPASKQMVINDIVARNKQTKIIESLPSFIEKEYKPFFKSGNQVTDPELANLKTKEEVYVFLQKTKQLTPLTKPFNDEYGRICKELKLM